jgi:FlaA1/EpsC-like NDP-sugar epimerase
MIAMHGLLVWSSLFISWLLRFEFRLVNLALLLAVAPVLILYRLAALHRYGLLHGYWLHAANHDEGDIVKSVGLGSAAFLITVRYLFQVRQFPLSVYILEAVTTSVIVVGLRAAARWLRQKAGSPQEDRRRKQRVLIAGAGFAGQLLIQDLKRSASRWEVVGFVDDDGKKTGARIHGVPVLGAIGQIPALSSKHHAYEVLIAIPSATSAQMQRIVEICDGASLRYKTVPSLQEFVADEPSAQQLREVNLEDLLGRESVKMDLEPVRLKLHDTAVLVTGAAGSIGSELVRQILQYQPSVLVCLDQDETGLFDLQQKLGKTTATTNVQFCLADVTDRSRMSCVLSEYRIDSIFHAAAYKHVSLTESNICEVLENNVFGLTSLMDAADESCCSSFVLISSDKAVNPTSFMGCTKRIGELILAARPSRRMRSVTVRFGNVLGSQGSVVPLFQHQLRSKRQISVTHPEVTRYFMTIPEAVSLVLQAFAIGEHGDLLVLDMGQPVRIVDLARTLMKLTGIRESEVRIEFTGLRPGEKMHEELFYDYEERRTTSVGKITLARSNVTHWNSLVRQLEELLQMGRDQLRADVRRKVKEIIPEYSYGCESVPETLPSAEAAQEQAAGR